MKSCPTCYRTFEDTLTFCLLDGAILSPPFDPEATVQIPARRETSPQPVGMIPASSDLSPRDGAAVANKPKRLWPRLVLALLLTPVISVAALVITNVFIFNVFGFHRVGNMVGLMVMLATFIFLLMRIYQWWKREHPSG